MGENACATLRIEAPESARRAVTTIGVDPRHPPTGGIEVNVDGELSLGRGEVRKIENKSGRYLVRCVAKPESLSFNVFYAMAVRSAVLHSQSKSLQQK